MLSMYDLIASLFRSMSQSCSPCHLPSKSRTPFVTLSMISLTPLTSSICLQMHLLTPIL